VLGIVLGWVTLHGRLTYVGQMAQQPQLVFYEALKKNELKIENNTQ